MVLLIVSVTVGFLFANNGFRSLVTHYNEVVKLKKDLSELERRNTKLKREIYLLEKEDSYIEDIARRELGVISKDEVEYRFKK